nr:putative ribonuclease H-like domain-containing protein [Tanacetum cinerariifolium]
EVPIGKVPVLPEQHRVSNQFRIPLVGSNEEPTSPREILQENPIRLNQASTSGTLSSNTIPKGEIKAITTRSGVAYEGPSIPTPKKVVERETEETTNKEKSNFQGSTAHIQPLITLIPEPDVLKTLPRSNIPYSLRLNDLKLREKATNEIEKFFQIFQDLHFDISFVDSLILMPKVASTIKSLFTNKDKLFELAKIPLNENCSVMLLKKLLENLEDPCKFLIPCDFSGMDSRQRHFVKVGKFHFTTDFAVVDFEADPRVPLILGRSFLRTGRALIDVYGEEITLQVNDEAVTFNLSQTTRYSSTYDDLSVNQIDIIDVAERNLKQGEVVKAKPLIDEPSELELKELPYHLEYAYLEGADKLLVIISKDLKVDEKEALLKVLKSHKRAITWKITDIKARHSVSSTFAHYNRGSSSHQGDDDEDDGASRASTSSPTSYLNSLRPLDYQPYDIPTSSEQNDELLFERQPDLLNQTQQMHKELVNGATAANGSKPRSNTKKDWTFPAKSDMKKVEVHPRSNKSSAKRKNRVDSSISYKRTDKKVWQATGKLFATIGRIDRPLVFGLRMFKTYDRDRLRLRNFVKKFIRTVRFRNDHFGAMMGYGDYVIGGSVISRVYYVEGLGHNLFYVRQLCDSDLEVAFRKHSCYVRDMDGVELIKGSRGFNLYTISVEAMMKSSPICLLSKAFKNKSWLWHLRLNHLNFGTINELARKDLVRGLPRLKFEKDHLCSVCQLGKSKKHTHKPKAENTTLEVLHTLHIDLCGPMGVQTINGKKYILVIVDDYSRFTWVKFLRSKDETPKFVIVFLKQIQVGLNKTIRYIRTNNGTEFFNHDLTQYFESVGIFHQKSVPRTPQQNGVVKRQNRTLVEAAKTMLIFSKALMFLWAEAVATALYTQNRSLIHTRRNKTLYELVHDKKPDLTFI